MSETKISEKLGDYIGNGLARSLPTDVEKRAVLHILDTVAAIISGGRLVAGKQMLPYIRTLGGAEEATVLGSSIVTNAVNAAMANGTLAHADETDDSHSPSYAHPGCAVVPAALAVAEQMKRSGLDLIKAVSIGYDVNARMSAALGSYRFVDNHHSSHAFGGLFGATAAAAVLYGLSPDQCTQTLCYATHLAAGNNCFVRDTMHVEKGFVHGGMPAQRGVQAARMVAAGFIGSRNTLEGTPGLFVSFPETSNPNLAVEELGARFEVMRTTIKKWAVAMPIQSALHVLESLMKENDFRAADVGRIEIHVRAQQAKIVDNSAMPAGNIQYQLALLLLQGKVAFDAGHDHSLMESPDIKAIRSRICVVARSDEEFELHKRQAIVSVNLKDGRSFEGRTLFPPGMPENPLTTDEVVVKTESLIGLSLSKSQTAQLIEKIMTLGSVQNVSSLRPTLQKAD